MSKFYLKMNRKLVRAFILIVLLNVGGALTLNSVLDINGTFPYLLNNLTGQLIEPRDYMDFDNIYAPNETYRLKQTAQGRNYHLIKAFDFANYYQSDYWHYSNEEDLKMSAQPVANISRCSFHLNWLEKKLNISGALFIKGQEHINLMTLVDSFGKPESGTFYGHGYWLGSYYECVKVAVDLEKYGQEEFLNLNDSWPEFSPDTKYFQSIDPGSRILKSRYCVGKVRDKDWPSEEEDNYVPRISYKVGLCIPESCDTSSMDAHKDQIERLMRFNIPDYMRERMQLSGLYCLPDERSPIRALKLSTRIFIGLNVVWIVVLLASTVVYSSYKRHQKDLLNIINSEHALKLAPAHNQQVTESNIQNHFRAKKEFSNEGGAITNSIIVNGSLQTKVFNNNNKLLENGLVRSSNDDDEEEEEDNRQNFEEQELSSYQSSSSSSLSTSLLEESPFLVKIFQAFSILENMREFREAPKLLSDHNSKRLRINLNALDSIKCLCCILVIFGHIIFIHMQHLSDIIHTIHLSYCMYPRILIAFFNFVDTFFIISGMLTAYFILKRFNRKTFSNPFIWFYISLLRLLRLSPVYVLILWFAKTVTVYLSSGPLWDYGTDKNSIKGLCINDHWWKSILYFGNVGTMQPLCILPAWSIIVDSQYSIVVPPILYLVLRNKRLAYTFLTIATIISTAKMSIQLANQTAVKTSDMAKVRLHVYPLISRFAAEFYNTAWNRIGPVAVGIFGGHMLYLYDIGKIKRWPWFMRGLLFKLVLSMHLFIFILPVMSKYTDDPESASESDLTIFLVSNATIKPIWSIINTIFLLRLITDLRKSSYLARLASHNIWHCMGKLCFASYIVHYEVILYLLKSRQDGLVDPTWSNALREFSVVFLISTILSYIIYILYEAPINKFVTLLMVKPSLCRIRAQSAENKASDYDAEITFNLDNTDAKVQKKRSNSSLNYDKLQQEYIIMEDKFQNVTNDKLNERNGRTKGDGVEITVHS